MKLSFFILKKLYLKEKKSVFEIAGLLKCSESKVNYWIRKYKIPKRSISDAIYIKHNPKGDPFRVNMPKNLEETKLFGLGLGLYWGEGNKANKNSIRLGNTDPKLIKNFIEFLIKFFSIKKSDLKFGLQIFSDMVVRWAVKVPSVPVQIAVGEFGGHKGMVVTLDDTGISILVVFFR